MNWILTILFFIVIFPHYYLLGNTILNFFKYKTNLPKSLIAGYIFNAFIFFVIGVPCQLFHTSWRFFFWVQLFLLVVVDILFIIINRQAIKNFVDQFVLSGFLKRSLKLLKQNWVCMLFIGLFTIFSMANQLPIYQMNYDDFYYIGKIVNLIDAPQLLNEDYFSGSLLPLNEVSLFRLVNTYELYYGFYSTIFHIDVTFFCRATMVLHNYFFFAVVYKELASIVVDRKYSQFVLLPFFIFLIPHGFLQSNFLSDYIHTIRSYDLWQFQTAAFYGGSVVRMLSIPTLFIFSYPMLKKIELGKIVWIAVISFAFLSFSTIFLQVFLLFALAIFLLFFCYQLYFSIKSKNKVQVEIYLGFICAFIVFMLFTKYLDHFSFINTKAFQDSVYYFADFDKNWIRNDLLFMVFPIVFVIGMYVSKEPIHRSIYFLGLFFFLLFRSSQFYELLSLTSINQYFVIYRTLAACQYLVLFLVGLSLIQLSIKWVRSYLVMSLINLVCVFSVVIYFLTHMQVFVFYAYNGSGISTDGWNFSRVFDPNNRMTATIFSRVGDYLNTLPYGNYRFFAPSAFVYDDITTYELGFMMSSNRIQIHERGGFAGMTDDESKLLTAFALDDQNIDFNQAYDLLVKYNVQYVLMMDGANKELLNAHAEEVLTIDNISGRYVLLRMN